MTRLEKFKKYMDLCGIYTAKELKEMSHYPKSVQYLRTVLRGDANFNEEEEKLCYEACNLARAVKQGKVKKDEKQDNAIGNSEGEESKVLSTED